ncbi:V-set domain-containing T-cell activation inhibitor 1-like [Hyperolius riggenbachi]|uniref:V-set domain-containing T-cell activation inhibitor 1-like n=1 Tax=Hyperolius riggenbachi TaxID=752182 RepID=UPI0035A2EC4D
MNTTQGPKTMRYTLSLLLLYESSWILQGLKQCPKADRNISVVLGGVAHLPCTFSPLHDAPIQDVKVSWQKDSGMGKEMVVHFQNGKEEGDRQDKQFKNRTAVGRHWYRHGNAKLSLHGVTREDAGKYTCWVTLLPLRPGRQFKCCTVTLQISEDTKG